MADIIFLGMMVLTVGSAIVALEADEIIYGAIGLAGSLLGVATLFFLLDAPYVAVFQIAVYVGAVAVLILFTVMLVRQERWAKEVPAKSLTKLAGALTGLAVFVALTFAVIATNLSQFTQVANTATFVDIGDLISTGDSPILLVLALVLAASVVGALTLSKVEREEKPQ